MKPFFSIVIPTYNRPGPLRACLQSLTHLDYPCDRFEVIVVNDGGETPLESVVEPYRVSLNLTLITQSNAGPASARNAGVRRACGSYVVFTDDDCAATPEWLKALAVRVSAEPDAMIGGRTLNALPHDWYAAASQAMTDAVYIYFNADVQQAQFFPSNNMTLSTAGFDAIGGFDVTFPLAASEDRELCDRWRHAGHRMIYAPDAIVHHAHALTLCQFWRQHFNYGRGDCHFHRVKAQHGRGSVPAEPGFFAHLFRYPFTHVQGLQVLRLESLFVMAFAAKTTGFFWEKAAGRAQR